MSLLFEFVNFFFTNSTAIELYNFFKTCEMPGEHYYALVYMIPNAPGVLSPDITKTHYFETDNWCPFKLCLPHTHTCASMGLYDRGWCP